METCAAKKNIPAGMRGTGSGARNRDGFGCVPKIDGRIQHGFDDARPYGEIAETFVGIASRRPFADQVFQFGKDFRQGDVFFVEAGMRTPSRSPPMWRL